MRDHSTRAPADFSLYKYLASSHGPFAATVLGGSATPSLTIKEIISLSTDQAATTAALITSLPDLPLGLASDRGSKQLRANIAATYSPVSNVTADHIVVANGTTGANHIVHRSLLKSGDHVLVQYPVYGPCIEEPRDIGCDISYVRLNPSATWSLDPRDLEAQIKPGKTKMIIINSPANPTGTFFDTATQRALIAIAKKHDIYIHCDEIFRPLFHTTTSHDIPPSLTEHPELAYDKIIVTSSLSKSYGLSGIRIGWITTRSTDLCEHFLNYRMYSIQSLSQLDETVATEVLSPRCRPGILNKHLQSAKQNLDLIQGFISKHASQCEWVRPTAGAVAFVKFKDRKTGKAVDDVAFCAQLQERTGVLLAPASQCFEIRQDGAMVSEEDKTSQGMQEFKGRVRWHFTCKTETLERGIAGLTEFLADEESAR